MNEENRKIVDFIRDTYIIPMNNNSKFAKENGIDEKTVRKIKDDLSYQIGLSTIIKICKNNSLSLADFFKKVGV